MRGVTSPATTERSLMASETVYFHPDRFARERSLLDAFALLHTDRKYDLSELAEAMLLAAFVDAERAGAIRLARDKASRLFGLRKVDALFAHPGATRSAFPAGTLEASIAGAVADGSREVERVVHQVLADDAPAPHWLVPSLVLRGLHARGLLTTREERRLKVFRSEVFELPDATRALAARTSGDEVRARVDAWRADRGDEAALLVKGIGKGIASRKEAGDGPD